MTEKPGPLLPLLAILTGTVALGFFQKTIGTKMQRVACKTLVVI